jgi:hypothetical protein
MPTKPTFKKVTNNLNIVLSKDELNAILKEVLGPKGVNINPGLVAIASDYCCVDASVGSSVIGPASTVASSVSVPVLEGIRSHELELNTKIDKKKLNAKIVVPKNISIK